MDKLEKSTIYFLNPGSDNTGSVIEAVIKRLESEDIKTIVVASTSGRTGRQFAEALKDKAKVISVSHRKMRTEFKDEIVKLGGEAVDETHLPLHGSGMDDVRNSLYILGQGFKVAVEIILIATDKGVVDSYGDVIGVAGSGGGSDTAIVARATLTRDLFSKDPSKKLEVREIIALPLKKK